MSQTQRIQWIDNTKGLILFFVLLFHAKFPWLIVQFASSWFMPCFFLISGLLFRMKNDSVRDTLLHRARTLLLPYFALSVLFVFLNPNNYHGGFLLAFKTNIWDILMGNSGFMTVSLWFVYVLFEVCLATVFLHQATRNFSEPLRLGIIGLVMTGCLILDALFHNKLLPLKLSDFFIAWFMYLLGYILQPYNMRAQTISVSPLAIFAGIVSAISIILFAFGTSSCPALAGLLRIGLILCGSFSMISVVAILTRIIPENLIGRSLRYLATNAICFLAVHMWVICLCQLYLPRYNPYVAATLGLTVSLVMMPLADRFTPWLVGKTHIES